VAASADTAAALRFETIENQAEDVLLDGRTAIITGAASPRGIGKATARLFADHGARIGIVDLAQADPQAAAADIGAPHRGYACDVRDKAGCEAVARRAIADFGQVDILINNAAISRPNRIMEVAPADYDEVMDVNLRGTMYMSQALIPYFRERRAGVIVCLASVAAQRGGGLFGGPHYAASKGGVLALAKAMARELAPEGIRVNAVAPSMIDTDIYQGQLSDEQREKVRRSVPMGRLGEAREVAGACLFLASELASYVTGTVIDVNGGSHIH
jgi:NAD(P)-dependent dehydrogenase (short-subunit alcohol dehydrogenase family)